MHRGKHKKDGKKSDMPWSWAVPSWFTSLYMNKPEKAANKQWETKMKKVSLADIEEHEHPLEVGKPKQRYYW